MLSSIFQLFLTLTHPFAFRASNSSFLLCNKNPYLSKYIRHYKKATFFCNLIFKNSSHLCLCYLVLHYLPYSCWNIERKVNKKHFVNTLRILFFLKGYIFPHLFWMHFLQSYFLSILRSSLDVSDYHQMGEKRRENIGRQMIESLFSQY